MIIQILVQFQLGRKVLWKLKISGCPVIMLGGGFCGSLKSLRLDHETNLVNAKVLSQSLRFETQNPSFTLHASTHVKEPEVGHSDVVDSHGTAG